MKHSAVAIGTFDGFHLGHRHLVGKLIDTAQEKGLRSVLVALSKPVKAVERILTTQEEKVELIRQYPLDEIVVIPVSQELIAQPAAIFFEEFLCKKLNMKHLVVGYDFAFGRGRQGDTDWLVKECSKHASGITIVEPLRMQGQIISSTLIRKLLIEGNVSLANIMLGRPGHFSGIFENCSGRYNGAEFYGNNRDI